MGHIKCLVCFKDCLPKQKAGVKEVENGNVLNYTVADPDLMKNELQKFLLRNLLEVSEDICCKFLQDYGDPCLWINCCHSCSVFVDKAKRVYDQIILLQNQFDKLKRKIKNAIVLSIKSDNNIDMESKFATEEILQSYLNREYTNFVCVSKCKADDDLSPEIDLNYELNCLLDAELLHNSNLEDDLPENLKHTDSFIDADIEDSLELVDDLSVNEVSDPKEISIASSADSQPKLIEKPKQQATIIFDKKQIEEIESIVKKPNGGLYNPDEGIDMHMCDECGKTFDTLPLLKIHESEHTGEKLYICNVCGKRMTQSVALKRHLRIHDGEKPHKCKSCSKSFRQVSTLQEHVSRVHAKKKPLNCSFCTKSFVKPKDLHCHIEKHTGVTSFHCSICEKGFRSSRSLRKHEIIHANEKPFTCETCGKGFTQSGNLKIHERTHTKEKSYECEICGKRFGREVHVKHHMRVHNGQKSFECDICGNCFGRSTHLKDHLALVHGKQ